MRLDLINFRFIRNHKTFLNNWKNVCSTKLIHIDDISQWEVNPLMETGNDIHLFLSVG